MSDGRRASEMTVGLCMCVCTLHREHERKKDCVGANCAHGEDLPRLTTPPAQRLPRRHLSRLVEPVLD